ncbi:MAG: aldo/keto reductase [Planctomycetota bacterium]
MTARSLPTARLGGTDVEVTTLGLGTAPLGGLFTPVSVEDAAATIDAAWEGGVRFFDTAPWYGFGRAERRLGDRLRGREGWALATKVGRLLVPSDDPPGPENGWPDPLPFAPVHDYGYDAVHRSFEDSLQRLGLARIDVLFVHDIGRMVHGDAHDRHFADAMDGGLRALSELRADGRIGALGIGVNEIEVLLAAMDRADWDVFLVAGRYTLLEQGALTELLPRCGAAGTSVVVGGAYNSGLLAGGSTWNYADAPAELLERRDRLAAVARTYGVALEAAALRFPLGHPAVASVVIGARTEAEMRANLTHAAAEIPPELWDAYVREGLVDEAAPVPRD